MAQAHSLKSNWSAGELSPLMRGRSDHPRYANGAAILENWQVLQQGGITRRAGLRWVGSTNDPDRLALLLPFEASMTDAYMLEVGHEYLWIYKEGVRLGSIALTTPYQEGDLRQLRIAQANDLLILVHPDHAPRRLSRLSDTDWTFQTIRFDPPPTYEAGEQPATTLTPSATTGSITLTTAVGAWLEADVDRQVQAGNARAVITGYTSPTVVQATVLDAFPDTSAIAAGSWTILGSPAAQCKPSKAEPAGAQIDLDLQLVQDDETELSTNGTMESASGWTDRSAPVVSSGTADGGSDTQLLDTAAGQFQTDGVEVGHVAFNTTDGTQDRVEAVLSETELTTAASGATWSAGKDYSVRQTGTFGVSGGTGQLAGGENGIGWAEQGVTTVVGRRYRLTFDVATNPLSVQIGSTAQASDITSEQTYGVGNTHAIVFTATTTTTYIQFRNNQNYTASFDNVSVKLFSAEGWRSGDVGKHVYLNNGLVKISSFVDATKVRGEIQTVLGTDEAAAPGAWSLEEDAWSDALGWPGWVMLEGGRLVFAGTASFPQTIWESEVDGLFNFARGVNSDDAVVLHLTQAAGNITLNKLLWVLPGDRLIAGTSHAEYTLVGANDDAITPTNPPRVRQSSTLGSALVAPVIANNSVLMVQRQGSKLWELRFDFRTERFEARELTIVSGHLLDAQQQILQLAYQQEPIPILWAVRSDGQLLGLTYDLVENVIGWFRVVTAGSVESVAVMPHPTQNASQVWCTVRRTLNGSTVRSVEYFDCFNPTDPLTNQDGLQLDAAVVDTADPASSTISGLDHLEGETIQAVGDGALFPDLVVSGGQVTLADSDGTPIACTTRQAGLPYTALQRSLPPDLPQLGTIRHKPKRWSNLYAILHETMGLKLNGHRLPFLVEGAAVEQGRPVFTGLKEIVTTGWDQEAVYTLEADLPFPATVLAIIGSLEVEVEE